MIDWVPIVFVAFKVSMFGAAMFFAIKWHYDQDKQGKDKRGLLLTFGMANMLGMDLSLP